MRIIALLFFIMCSVGVNAQQVKLSRLERAAGKDYIPFTDVNGKQSYQLLQGILDTMVVGGSGGGDVFGNGTQYGLDAMWVNDSTLWRGHVYWDSIGRAIEFYADDIYDTWIMSLDSTNKTVSFDPDMDADADVIINATIVGFNVSTGQPVMSSTNSYHGWKSDSDTYMRRLAANHIGLHGGDTTNPMLELIGDSDVVNIDPNDDNTLDVILTATTADFISEVRINTPSTDNTTHLAGMDASEDVTKLALSPNNLKFTAGASVDTVEFFNSYGELYYNGEFDITNTSSDTLLPDFGWQELDAGDIFTTAQYGEITTEYTGFAHFFFSCTIENGSGSNYTGSISFDLYKNNTWMSYPVSQAIAAMGNTERKTVSFQMIIPVTTNDDYHIRAYLSSAGTITVVNPVFNLQRI